MNASISRRNMRYRGPVESDKLDTHYAQTQHSLQDLYTGLQDLRVRTQMFKESQLGRSQEITLSLVDANARAAQMKGAIIHV